jgi:hypothetical protein
MESTNKYYSAGTRVEYLVRPSFLRLRYAHKVGYIKTMRKYWFLGERYLIQEGKSSVVDVVKPSDVLYPLKSKIH